MTEQESTRNPNEVRDDEPVSALVDGELDPRGADFVIRRVAGDDELRLRWHRFHLVRACLQGEFGGAVPLVARVREALEDEAAPSATFGARARLWQIAGGGAVAACVAVVAVVGLANRIDQQAPGADDPAEVRGFVSESTALDRQFNPRAVPAGYGGASEARADGADRAAQLSRSRINRYMIRHSQMAGGNGFSSFTPVLAAPDRVRVVRPESDGEGSRRERTE